MPRPKRTKIVSSNVKKSENKKITTAKSVISKASFDDLYDISDQEDGGRNHCLRSTDIKECRKSLSNSLERSWMECKQVSSGNELHSRHSLEQCSSRSNHGSQSSSPANEITRKELSTPKRGCLTLAMGELRSQSNSASLRAIKPDSIDKSPLIQDTGLHTDSRVEARDSSGSLRQSMRRMDNPQTPAFALTAHQYCKDYEEEYGFDASTPLNFRNNTPINTSPSVSSSLKSKKRKLSEIQVLQSSYEASQPIISNIDDIIPATNPQNIDINNKIEENVLIPSIEGISITPQKDFDIMAPPHCSSSIPSSPIVPLKLIRNTSKKLRSPSVKTPAIQNDLESDLSSPPSLTHSPESPARHTKKSRTRNQNHSPCRVTTSQLQNLLPKRRRRIIQDFYDDKTSENELDTTKLASDDDELAHLNLRPRAQTRNPGSSSYVAPTRAAVINKKPMQRKPQNPRSARSYGIRSKSRSNVEDEIERCNYSVSLTDKKVNGVTENQDKKIGKALKKMAQKFQEVDKWVLEFEDAASSNASPKDAR